MSIQVLGQADSIVDQIKTALEAYQKEHSDAQIDLYRQNSVSVRVRIIDPDFSTLDRAERNDSVWKFLDHLSEDAQADVSMLVLLAPREQSDSFANFEFDHPTRSGL